MPAAPVADTLALPAIPLPSPAARLRPVVSVIKAPTTIEGAGFQVRRPFPGIDLHLADPFLLLDHLGAVEYAPGEARGAPWWQATGIDLNPNKVSGCAFAA